MKRLNLVVPFGLVLRGLCLLLASVCAATWAHAQPGTSGDAPSLLMRISTENVESHFQTRFLQRFVDELRRRTQGRLEVDFRHSARLFRDQSVIHALSEGQVEMAVPGHWQFERYDPSACVLTLPMYFGRSADEHHGLRDGRMGQMVSEQLAQSLEVVVLGRWVDLGPAHLFTTRKPVHRHEDLAGMRIRIAGGVTIAAQLSTLGARPVLVAWPDLIQVLAQGRLDGVLTTYETAASARLWQHGLRYVTENRAYFAQYVPVVSARFWQRLPPDLQLILRSTWDELVDSARRGAAQAQLEARAQLKAQGMVVIEPSSEVLKAWRREVSLGQADLVRTLGVPEPLMREAGRLPP